MSRPTAISPEEQEQIARKIGVLLLQAAPDDWQRITVEYRATGEYHDLLGEVARQSGDSDPWDPPEDLRGIFEHLREGMYRSDIGTWLSALYVVERPSSYRIDINFDSEPQWRRPLPRAAYVDELRRYPRADENVPDWMRAKLDSPAHNGEAADPALSFNGAESTGYSPSATPPALEPQPPVAAPAPAPQEPASQPSPEEPSSRSEAALSDAAPFRAATVFEDFDEQGRPLIATRLPVPSEEIAALRQYLENAPIVLASRDNEEDILDLDRPVTVPATWHTDGVWLWQGAVAYYLTQYGLPPEQELLDHVRDRRFALTEIDDHTRDAAVSQLLDRPAPDPASTMEHDVLADDEDDDPHIDPAGAALTALPDRRFDTGDEATTATPGEPRHQFDDVAPEHLGRETAVGADVGAERLGHDAPVSDSWQPEPESRRHGLGDEDGKDTSSDPDEIFARLRGTLREHGIGEEEFRIGGHTAHAHCVSWDGSDWSVTGPVEADPGLSAEIRFRQASQAAAYLLGSLLLSRETGPFFRESGHSPDSDSVRPIENPVAHSPRESQSPRDSQRDIQPLGETEPPRETQPQRETPPLGGSPSLSDSADLPRRTPGSTQPPSPAPAERQSTDSGGHFLFTSNEHSSDHEAAARHEEPGSHPDVGQVEQRPVEEPTRLRPAPRLDRSATAGSSAPADSAGASEAPPPSAPAAGTSTSPGQPVQSPPHGDPSNGGPGAAGQPSPLPKRPRPEQQGNRPPGQTGPSGERLSSVGPPSGPPQAGPTPQGPGGPIKRPPQGPTEPPPRSPQGPSQAPPAPAGREQQHIQPLRGEPPLTLYRDRRPMVLQPGTDLDRFGDANGNVTYAIRTPYSQRSLPPQWASRPYAAYRVQRPVQVLRGTAVPWFEQPGGGTAYVLPASISELMNDGVLHELSGNEAPPRPAME